jgi:hypothetical protein
LSTCASDQGDHPVWREGGGCIHSESGQGRCPGNFIPSLGSFATELSIISSGEKMASAAEVGTDDSVNLDEPLDVLAGLEPAHSPLRAC